MSLHVWIAGSELTPLAQTGGLGEVLRDLPIALAKKGVRVRRFLPAYGSVDRTGFVQDVQTMKIPSGKETLPVRFWSKRDGEHLTTTLVECDRLFEHKELYGPPGEDFPDNPRRFAAFCRAICELAHRDPDPPQILHAHDWQTALIPLYVKFLYTWRQPIQTLFTIHNLAYQGSLDPSQLGEWSLGSDLEKKLLCPEGIEIFGSVNAMKAGILYADCLTTVSPTYAREILTPEFGEGLHDVLRSRADRVIGILNGVSEDIWNPSRDLDLPQTYTEANVAEGKSAAQALVRETFGIAPSSNILMGYVGRLAHQKGIDVLLDAIPRIIDLPIDLAILGSGDIRFSSNLARLATRYTNRIGYAFRFDTKLSHMIMAGSDLFVLPSRFEPCGLGQLYALRYGAIPIVHRTGGLLDTVRDAIEDPARGTGFIFTPLTASTLLHTIRYASELHSRKPEDWKAIQHRGMTEDFSWSLAADKYLEVYSTLAEK